jgi:hypothetical protein
MADLPFSMTEVQRFFVTWMKLPELLATSLRF